MSTSEELSPLVDRVLPHKILALCPADVPELARFRTRALLDLDRIDEAREFLDGMVPRLEGDEWNLAEALWGQLLLDIGNPDGGILALKAVADKTGDAVLKARSLAWIGLGYGMKGCPELAERHVQQARELAPADGEVHHARARLRLLADRRIDARNDWALLLDSAVPRDRIRGLTGLAHVAWLLGDFAEAGARCREAMTVSAETLAPLFLRARVALAENDAEALAVHVSAIETLSPESGRLPSLKTDLEHLKNRNTGDGCNRLQAFPSLVQKRNHCGPSTIELVLRYWKGAGDMDNEEIARHVKFPRGGTPMYRLREFFHLVRFDTIRCTADTERLMMLVDAGFPAIVEQEYSNSSHVAVVIGYDRKAGTLELQDPMTHEVTILARDESDRIRNFFGNTAVVAFPSGQGHEKTLARLGFFDDPVTLLFDQACQDLDADREEDALAKMAKAQATDPKRLSLWMVRLIAGRELWQNALKSGSSASSARQGLSARLGGPKGPDPVAARERFMAILEEAAKAHPDAELTCQYQGQAALMDRRYPEALDAWKRAHEADPQDAGNLAAMAECYFALGQVDEARDTAWKSLCIRADLGSANGWMARCQAWNDKASSLHYADAAAELAPGDGLPSLALAEIHLKKEEPATALRHADHAVSLMPGNPDPLLVRALTVLSEDPNAGVDQLETLLGSRTDLPPMVRMRALRALFVTFRNADILETAKEQIEEFHRQFPDDPWGLEMHARTSADWLLRDDRKPAKKEKDAQEALFRKALEVTKCDPDVASSWLEWSVATCSAKAVKERMDELKTAWPDRKELLFLEGSILEKTGKSKAAAEAMIQALLCPGAINDGDNMRSAIDTVMEALGPKKGSRTLEKLVMPQGGIPQASFLRALGIALSIPDSETAELSRKLLEQALARRPDDVVVMVNLADVTEDEDRKEALLRRGVMEAPDWAYARYALVQLLLSQDKDREALEFSTGHEHDSTQMAVAHGKALRANSRYDDAAVHFAKIFREAEEKPGWMYYYHWLAHKDAGDLETAMATAREALEVYGDEDADWYWYLADILCLEEKFDEALQALEEGAAKGLEDHKVTDGQYDIAFARKDWEGALVLARKLAESEGDPEELGHREGQCIRLLAELDRPGEIREFLEAKKLDAEGWGEAAWAILRADRHELTMELSARSLALDPQNHSGLYCRAQTLVDMGKEEEAAEAFRILMDAHPEEHNSYEKFAFNLAVQGDLDQALHMAERAVQLGGFCPFAWTTRGIVRFFREDTAGAREDLEKAWKQGDHDDRRQKNVSWWLLAVLQGDHDLARNRKERMLGEASTMEKRALAKAEALLAAGAGR